MAYIFYWMSYISCLYIDEPSFSISHLSPLSSSTSSLPPGLNTLPPPRLNTLPPSSLPSNGKDVGQLGVGQKIRQDFVARVGSLLESVGEADEAGFAPGFA